MDLHPHPDAPVRILPSLTLLLATAIQVSAQELPLLDPARIRLMNQEVSGDAAYKHIRYLTQMHRPRGSENLWTAATYVEAKAREAGLTRISLIKQAQVEPPWNNNFGDLWIVGDRPERIASTLQNDVHLGDHSRPANVTADLIDIGGGTDAELASRDVRGKIVLTFGDPNTIMRTVVAGRGAAGLVAYPDPSAPPNGVIGAGMGRPDQVPWLRLPRYQLDGKEPTWGFSLSLRQGLALARRIKTSPTPLRAHAVIEADSGRGDRNTPWSVMVEAYIEGTDPTAGQDIVLTGHLQEGPHSANDDGSGVASMLEIGRALTKLIADGRLPRPRRNIRFWWTTEMDSPHQYFADHPDAAKSMWVEINQDMVGAEQTIDLTRKQDITRLPASRFHFFNDVAESVTEYMVAANTIYLSAIRGGTEWYPEPHLAHFGSQHRYAAEMVWFHEDTDHMTFVEPPIGIPAITFTNMPDRFIHSNEDDLWNVDATQLGRNALSVSMIAYIMASADAQSATKLTVETVGRGEERIARNLRLALGRLARSGDPAVQYAEAIDQVQYAVARERLAVRSLTEIARGAVDTTPLIQALDRREAEATSRVRSTWLRSHGATTPPVRVKSATERTLEAMTPAITGGPKEFLAHRRDIKPVQGLNQFIRAEVIALIDGKRTGFEIYRVAAAEVREAGAVYYGVMTPELVLATLRAIEETGLARLR